MNKIIMAFILLITIPLIIMLPDAFRREASLKDMEAYIMQTQDDVVGLYPNTFTKEPNDFFVESSTQGTVFVTVLEQGEGYSHTEELVEGNTSLEQMSVASIEETHTARTVKKNRPITPIIPMPILIR